MQAKDAVGQYGERVAAQRLRAQGWRILDRNWRGTRGELDIVALDETTLVIVEVKTRTGRGFGSPAEAVTSRKLAQLRRLAGEWAATHVLHASAMRIDVISIEVPRRGAPIYDHLQGVSI